MPGDIIGGTPDPEIEAVRDGNSLTILVTPRDDGVPLGTLLRALSDSLRILKDLDVVVSHATRPTLEWVVISASLNSPLTLQIIGRKRPNSPGPGRVAEAYLRGIYELEHDGEPGNFSEKAMEGAKDIALSSLRDGVASVQFSGLGLPPVTPSARLVDNVNKIIKKRYYFEESLIEGRLETISIHGEPHLVIYDILTGRGTRCFIGEALIGRAMESMGQRITVDGKVKFARDGWPQSIQVTDMRRMRSASELPQFAEGDGIDITGGVESSEYVRRLRDGE